MKTLWDFIIKYDFLVSVLIIICLYIGEYIMSGMWMGELAMIVTLIALTRLAYNPMWKKDKEA